MKGLNECRFIGNVTADPDIKQTPAGRTYARFSLAVNKRVTDKESGEIKEFVTFVPVVAWGRLAEAVVEKFVKKGVPLYVAGAYNSYTYEAEDGEKRYRTDIIADEIILLGGQRGEREDNFPSEEPGEERKKWKGKHQERAKQKKREDEDLHISDIPF